MAKLAFYEATVEEAVSRASNYGSAVNRLRGQRNENPSWDFSYFDLPVDEIALYAQGPGRIIHQRDINSSHAEGSSSHPYYMGYTDRLGGGYYAERSYFVPLPLFRRDSVDVDALKAALPSQLKLYSVVRSDDNGTESEFRLLDDTSERVAIWFDAEWWFQLWASRSESRGAPSTVTELGYYHSGVPHGMYYTIFDAADALDAAFPFTGVVYNVVKNYEHFVAADTRVGECSLWEQIVEGFSLAFGTLGYSVTSNDWAEIQNIGDLWEKARMRQRVDGHFMKWPDVLAKMVNRRKLFNALKLADSDGTVIRPQRLSRNNSDSTGRQVVLVEEEEPTGLYLQESGWLGLRLSPDYSSYYVVEREITEEDVEAAPHVFIHHDASLGMFRALFMRGFGTYRTALERVVGVLAWGTTLTEREVQRHPLRFYPPRGTPARVAHALKNYPFLASVISHVMMELKGTLPPRMFDWLEAGDPNASVTSFYPKNAYLMRVNGKSYNRIASGYQRQPVVVSNVWASLGNAGVNSIPHDDDAELQRVAGMPATSNRAIDLDGDEDLGVDEMVAGSRSVDLEV